MSSIKKQQEIHANEIAIATNLMHESFKEFIDSNEGEELCKEEVNFINKIKELLDNYSELSNQLNKYVTQIKD